MVMKSVADGSELVSLTFSVGSACAGTIVFNSPYSTARAEAVVSFTSVEDQATSIH